MLAGGSLGGRIPRRAGGGVGGAVVEGTTGAAAGRAGGTVVVGAGGGVVVVVVGAGAAVVVVVRSTPDAVLASTLWPAVPDTITMAAVTAPPSAQPSETAPFRP